MKKIYCIFLFFLSYTVFSQTFSRHELLEEGRSSLNVINEYDRIKSIEVDLLYVDLYFKSFEPYSIDTSSGVDKTLLFFGGLNVMVNVGNTSRFVFISQLFWMSSKNREYLDGDGDRKNVRYGLATDFYIGVDQRLFNFVVLQLGTVIGHSSLYDSNVDTAHPGENLYTMTNVEKKWRLFPTFGAYLYGFTLINLGTSISYSVEKKRVSNSQTVVDIRFSFFIEKMGDLRIGYKTYSFMENEQSMIVEWHNLYKMIHIGVEVFTKDVNRLGNVFLEVRLDIFDIFKIKITQKAVSDTPAVRTESALREDSTPAGEGNQGTEQNTKKKKPPYMKPATKETKLFLITRFNFARTRETQHILDSDKFVFGIKIGLSFSFKEKFIVDGYYLRNVFEEILQFRHSVNRHGFLLRMIFHI